MVPAKQARASSLLDHRPYASPKLPSTIILLKAETGPQEDCNTADANELHTSTQRGWL